MNNVAFQVAIYMAKFGDGHFIDDGIAFHTGFWNGLLWTLCNPSKVKEIWKLVRYRFSHIEIHNLQTDECFTSTMRGELNGTVIRPASEVFVRPERWMVIKMYKMDFIFNRAWSLAVVAAKYNKGYDKKCIIGFFLPWRIHDKLKNICSEAVQMFLVWCGTFVILKVWSPLRLVRKILNSNPSYKLEKLVYEH